MESVRSVISLEAMILTDQMYFNYFCRGTPSDFFFQIIFNCDSWFQRIRHSTLFLKILFHFISQCISVPYLESGL